LNRLEFFNGLHFILYDLQAFYKNENKHDITVAGFMRYNEC